MFFRKLLSSILVIFLLFFYEANAQKTLSKVVEDSVIIINSNNSIADFKKLQLLYFYKRKLEQNISATDSIYANILHLIGKYEFFANKDYYKAIYYTTASVKINTSGKANCSQTFALKSYSNLSYYYKKIYLLTKSLQCCDSTIKLAGILKDTGSLLDAKITKESIYLHKGDYQKSQDECTIGLKISLAKNDSLHCLSFLNQRALAFFFQNNVNQSTLDVEKAISLANAMKIFYELATAYKTEAGIYKLKQKFDFAQNAYKEAIRQRILTSDYGQIAGDYLDFGNFYSDSLNDFTKAKACYFKGIEYAKKEKDSFRLAELNTSLGNTFFQEKKMDKSQLFYSKAFEYFKLGEKSFFNNPTSIKTDLIGDKTLLITLFKYKTELLLNQYLKNHNQAYLTACLNTALTTDSVINETRHEQLGEQSKLYWRDNTRDFYCNALEACYLANNANLAFFFMEKSRAVLLNDRLNELGASAHLPTNEAEKEDSLRSIVIQEEQRLADLKEGTKAYDKEQMKLLNARSEFDNYIQSLEQKFPIYYQYKYNDQVPDLKTLQQFLAINNQAFVHYFITDSIIYILGISANNTKLIKVAKQNFIAKQLPIFLKMCADYQALNSNYRAYINLSNLIYNSLFKPLQIQQKRVVICADNFLIPFGALCTDNDGKHFLVQDFAFSYAYSARSLLNPFNNPAPKGDLLGIAPVSFAPYLQLPELKQSAGAMMASSGVFNNTKLLLNEKATKNSFIKLLPQYSVVNVFSHANVDSSGEEPLLFMADSIIHLSALQTIKSPATQLVVLSACQTNVGKLATGEGIYSLARGFASSGIPSVSATLWKADEDAIYEITQSFDRNLAQGMRKDDALQQAELEFMQHGNEKLLPYFWANMVLVGNAAPVKLSSPNNWGLIVLITGIALFITTLVIIKNRRRLLRLK